MNKQKDFLKQKSCGETNDGKTCGSRTALKCYELENMKMTTYLRNQQEEEGQKDAQGPGVEIETSYLLDPQQRGRHALPQEQDVTTQGTKSAA